MAQTTQTAYCTTREAAQLLGVSLRTAQLWAESGLLEAWKTDGGHRRISRASVQRLLDGGTPAQRPEDPTRTSHLERLKVLVVEDDSILLKLYKTVIASWNLPVEVITAGNGIEGLIRVGKDAPDLMITDLSMPGMDGFQLIRNLASSSFREGMEIAVVTGMDAAEIEARGGLPPGIQVFPKPVPFVQLHTILDSIIERRAAYL
jgi:excisionase family DNA binding protein